MPRGCGKAGALLVSLVDDDRTRMMLVEVALDDPKVAGVRPEQQVKGVADERDGANRGVDAQIADHPPDLPFRHAQVRSEEHTSELQSLMRISYAVFCLTHKNTHLNRQNI